MAKIKDERTVPSGDLCYKLQGFCCGHYLPASAFCLKYMTKVARQRDRKISQCIAATAKEECNEAV